MNTATCKTKISILGIFAADLIFQALRLPRLGETILAESFNLGMGGKGSNQAVAAARAGADVALITRIGVDSFADLALDTWRKSGVDTSYVRTMPDESTGASFIYVSPETGENAIVVSSGAAGRMTEADVDDADSLLAESAVFLTQLEQPVVAMVAGLRAARRHGAITILNPAPAPTAALSDEVYGLCDFITPNESEAEALTGIAIRCRDDAERAAQALLKRGVKCVVITLGSQGALVTDSEGSEHYPCINAGKVVDTTGAGDAFNGALAMALAAGQALPVAIRFASAFAALSVTRSGAAASMPMREEVDALLSGQ